MANWHPDEQDFRVAELHREAVVEWFGETYDEPVPSWDDLIAEDEA